MQFAHVTYGGSIIDIFFQKISTFLKDSMANNLCQGKGRIVILMKGSYATAKESSTNVENSRKTTSRLHTT